MWITFTWSAFLILNQKTPKKEWVHVGHVPCRFHKVISVEYLDLFIAFLLKERTSEHVPKNNFPE